MRLGGRCWFLVLVGDSVLCFRLLWFLCIFGQGIQNITALLISHLFNIKERAQWSKWFSLCVWNMITKNPFMAVLALQALEGCLGGQMILGLSDLKTISFYLSY